MWTRIFITRRCVYAPTKYSLILIIATITITGYYSAHLIPEFFSIVKPVASDTILVEGWVPDYVVKEASDFCKSNNITTIFVVGGPIMYKDLLPTYRSLAEMTRERLRALGIEKEKIVTIDTPEIREDRTYLAAMHLKQWLAANNSHIKRINVFTLGLHGRRSRIMYQKALTEAIDVGVISVTDRSIEYTKWWGSSYGVKAVVEEIIGYIFSNVRTYK